MKKLVAVILISGFLFALASCSAMAIKLGEDDNGKTFTLAAGDKFTVSLPGNPTTGYTWEVNEIDPAVIELVAEPEYKADSNLIGAGGIFTFTFKALAPGDAAVSLIYHRSWEEGVAPLGSFSVSVSVK